MRRIIKILSFIEQFKVDMWRGAVDKEHLLSTIYKYSDGTIYFRRNGNYDLTLKELEEISKFEMEVKNAPITLAT